MALTCQCSRPVMPTCKIQLRHNLQQQEGSLFLRSGSTIAFWGLTNLPSSWRIQRCSRMVQRWSPQVHTRLAVDQGNPCHEPCSTTPSLAHSILPANLQIHQHNCMGRQGPVALSA